MPDVQVDNTSGLPFKQLSTGGAAHVTRIATANGGYSFLNLAANATTTVKTGAGFLHTMTINTKGATANTVTVYDNTAASGTKIGTFDTTLGQQTFVFDIAFSTGLTAIIATGTAADITFTYK